mmetsp:Transcript_3135/g.5932  ORF Transcript_3135/g.5932 Transcript_3135/m.5932 type:complete len:571 (-) Transcript_3135:129-1841(-)
MLKTRHRQRELAKGEQGEKRQKMWGQPSDTFVSFLTYCLLICPQIIVAFAGNEQDHTRDLAESFELARQNAEYQECVDDIYSSDIDGDMNLSEQEYLFFIAKRSNGAILADELADLPFSLITNFVFGACFCSIVFETPDCCVGSGAMIDLNPDDSPFIEDNLITICISVDEAIIDEIGSLPPRPTLPPTDAPTNIMTEAPSSEPSVHPSSQPTTAISSAPSVGPSYLPTAVVSSAPSAGPSDAPTSVVSSAPSVSPSSTPTNVTSAMPSVSPSSAPTTVASSMPSVNPSDEPTSAPSSAPSASPTSQPSASPSLMPTLTPTVATPMPTSELLTCVDFQYGIGNDQGFNADDILNEVGNTLATGLILATRNVTIETLNSTFPRSGSRRRLRKSLQRNHWPIQSSTKINTFLAFRPYELRNISHSLRPSMVQVTDLGRFRVAGHYTVSGLESSSRLHVDTEVRRRAVVLPKAPSTEKGSKGQRRLVYYTDQYEPVINTIFDNAFCEDLQGFSCAVVDSTVCVMLEEGDDEEEVQAGLLDGIEQSILDGSFQEAIPPEHQLPGGETIEEAQTS